MKPSPHLHRSNDTFATLWLRLFTFVSTLSMMQRNILNHIDVHASTLSLIWLNLTYFNSPNSLNSLNLHHSVHHSLCCQTVEQVAVKATTLMFAASMSSMASHTTKQTVVSSIHVRDAHIRIVCMYTAADSAVRRIMASQVVRSSSLN